MKLSIITVNYNNKEGLLQTIKTVLSQTNHNFEWLVIDGGSKDGSLEVIKDHQDKINFWVSEPDNGVYNAMNKGILAAKGDYILFLNSGDYFNTDEAISIINKTKVTEDFIICDYILNSKIGIQRVYQPKNPRKHLITGMYCHQSVLHKRQLFKTIGSYDQSYKIMADYAFLMNCFFRYNATFSFITEALVVYDDTSGISDYNNNSERSYIEERKKAQYEVFDHELVDEFTRRYELINDLKQIKSKYEGLLSSGLIKIVISIINFKRKIFSLLKK
jgi:glycosyltransferase involved in cell wall biosynthesis